MSSEDKRAIGRNFRIPIELDNKIIELQKENDLENVTDAYVMILKLGLKVIKYSTDVKVNPEERKKIESEFEDNINRIITHSVSSTKMTELTDAQLEYVLAKSASELRERQSKKLLDEGYYLGHAISKEMDRQREKYGY